MKRRVKAGQWCAGHRHEKRNDDDGQSERRSTEQAEEDCPSDLGIQVLGSDRAANTGEPVIAFCSRCPVTSTPSNNSRPCDHV